MFLLHCMYHICYITEDYHCASVSHPSGSSVLGVSYCLGGLVSVLPSHCACYHHLGFDFICWRGTDQVKGLHLVRGDAVQCCQLVQWGSVGLYVPLRSCSEYFVKQMGVWQRGKSECGPMTYPMHQQVYWPQPCMHIQQICCHGVQCPSNRHC